MKYITSALILSALLAVGGGAHADQSFWQTPTIQGAGKIHPLPDAAYQPDPDADYKVVFNVTHAADATDEVSPALKHVARTLNLYVHAGVPEDHLHFVAVLHGAATRIALDDAHYRQAYDTTNPDLPLIHKLRQHGVDVVVCGQAVAEHVDQDDWQFDGIADDVTLSLSALTTITELQQKGYALMPL